MNYAKTLRTAVTTLEAYVKKKSYQIPKLFQEYREQKFYVSLHIYLNKTIRFWKNGF